ncbi:MULTISPECIES: PLP-dependent aminotransferase family protein [unclassified Pseudomonas]|jgi:DNA-binding transcriptional MocR family regulator|uniref:GntR family transcriptional regulator n=1 Tax=Pseudomonas gorinensis TaxID=3240790 RepID=A0ACA7P5W0_9PSED|nr:MULTISPECIES: PLP-dependent aminotransferase family protein [unclassified Pseudomonas]AHC35197.1 GntR family transcriptional regulator [Pseudomonas sp. TKP]MBL1309044.1 PLP-dependent aminotransferase family protein [Pseudomonas sp.]PMX15739.1 PLP-dependent aminotransferase family protein [Pseudomonas sp. MPBC4-3]PMX47801.1 PLP-dependent aminotransferase family protein [Pseudomonas sp. FW301-21B01]PMY08324.1 PLP-dependent aminotransferase family protein [Pseudomonas sp. MPR-R5A]
MLVTPIAFVDGTPKVQQIVDAFNQSIEQGEWAPGSKLPSVRELTETLGVSKFTLNEALDRLRGRNLLTSSQGRGFFVAMDTARPASAAWVDLLPQDLLSVLRRPLVSAGSDLRPGGGHLPESWLDSEAIRQAMRSVVRAPSLRIAGLGTPAGLLPLRQALQHKLHGEGLSVPVEQIITTPNTVQGLDMLMRLLARPGDTVLLDAPCYFNFHANLALHGVKVLTIQRRPDGFDFAALEQLLAEHRPSLYLTTSVLHNPTGHSFSPGQAFRLLQLTQRYHCHIIEDDLYGDLHPNPPPRLAALAGLDQVTYLSGFSKILSANTRVSYVVAAPQLAANLTHMKLMSGGVTSELFEQIVYRMLSEGSYAKHRKRMVQRLTEAGGRVEQWLKRCGCELPMGYEGGMFIWARLPAGVDGERLAQVALKQGMVLAPGALFGYDPAHRDSMRFNVAHSDEAQVRQLFEALLLKA